MSVISDFFLFKNSCTGQSAISLLDVDINSRDSLVRRADIHRDEMVVILDSTASWAVAVNCKLTFAV